MTNVRTHSVACLSGHGIGAEVMAEASRSLRSVSRLHGFRVEETHVPYGGEALTQSGHTLPAATRHATLAADAILAAAAREPALAGVESELDLHARIDRVVFAPRGSLTVVSPLDDASLEWTVERAFDVACSSRAHVTFVGGDTGWSAALDAEAERHHGVLVEVLDIHTGSRALAFEPERFDVVITPAGYAEPLVGVAANVHAARVAASGRLARTGPGVFAPAHGAAEDIAGQGVANPSSMLLAASLMLGEGLGERRAAETLAGAVLEACHNGARTPDMVTIGMGATTREFGDAVLSGLPFAMTTAEFYREAVA